MEGYAATDNATIESSDDGTKWNIINFQVFKAIRRVSSSLPASSMYKTVIIARLLGGRERDHHSNFIFFCFFTHLVSQHSHGQCSGQ